MADKQDIKDLCKEEIEELFQNNGFTKYRAAQVLDWVYKDIDRFEQMENVPSTLISFLDNDFIIYKSCVLEKRISKDGTIKFLLDLKDGNAVECVLMEYKYGFSLCISSQVGCRMNCKFCASTEGGLIRNLTLGEMLEEVMAVTRETGKTISNIVLMGIGEPFDNYDNVMKFIRTVNLKNSFNIGMRHITLSTSGLVPKIYEFADEELQCNLAVSLHSANDCKRSKLMPINKKHGISELIKACKYYVRKTNRRISFEYILIDKINDGISDALELCNLVKDMLCYINLIPINYVENKGLIKPEDSRIEKFKDVLRQHNVSFTVRRELGQDIDGACGQLRKNYKQRYNQK